MHRQQAQWLAKEAPHRHVLFLATIMLRFAHMVLPLCRVRRRQAQWLAQEADRELLAGQGEGRGLCVRVCQWC